MIQRNTLYCMLGFVLLLASCKKDAELNLPYEAPKLVLSSFISPQDSLIQVDVSLTNPLSHNPTSTTVFTPVQTASVKIQDGLNAYDLWYDPILKRYVIDSFKLKIVAGTTYVLSVKTADGKFAMASTTIPVLNATLNISAKKNPLIKDGYFLEGTWLDTHPNYMDTYQFSVHYKSFYIFSGSSSIHGEFSDTVNCWNNNSISFSDMDKQPYNKTLSFTYRTNMQDTVIAELTVFSQEYVSYMEKRSKGAGGLATEFSEPIPMYTNVTGGVGVFAGFTRYSKRVFPL